MHHAAVVHAAEATDVTMHLYKAMQKGARLRICQRLGELQRSPSEWVELVNKGQEKITAATSEAGEADLSAPVPPEALALLDVSLEILESQLKEAMEAHEGLSHQMHDTKKAAVKMASEAAQIEIDEGMNFVELKKHLKGVAGAQAKWEEVIALFLFSRALILHH